MMRTVAALFLLATQAGAVALVARNSSNLAAAANASKSSEHEATSNATKTLEEKKILDEKELQAEINNLEHVSTDPEMAKEFESGAEEHEVPEYDHAQPVVAVHLKEESTQKAKAGQSFDLQKLKRTIMGNSNFQNKLETMCAQSSEMSACKESTGDALFCQLLKRSKPEMAEEACSKAGMSFVQVTSNLRRQRKAPEDELAKEMTHDLEMNFNKIAPFGKEDTAKELQDHAAKTQDTLVDAVENAEVAEIKRAVFRALTRLRAATIKEFDTIARLETQAIDAYNDAHHYRAENPLAHLHEDEAPVETDKLKSFH
jgi:hypothetical protein